MHHLHHVHIFASDIAASIRFYRNFFAATIVFDEELAGARNVFLRIGNGGLNLYDQPPKRTARGSIHHIGIQTDDLAGVVRRMKERGIQFRKDITDFGYWKYVMVQAPDDVLIELFEVDKTHLPPEYRSCFE